MSFLSGNNNDNFLDNCQGLQDLTVTLTVTEDLVTAANNGFSLQLNCYPQPGQIPQGQSLEQSGVVGDLSLTWLQYLIIVQNGFGFEIQYWSNNAKGYATGQPWPPGYNPDPPGTTPWLPVFPNTALSGGFGSSSSSQIAAGSTLEIQLTTDAATGNVTSANFSVTDPHGNVSSSGPQNFTTSPPQQLLDLRIPSRPRLATELRHDLHLRGWTAELLRLRAEPRRPDLERELQLHAARDRGGLQRDLRSAESGYRVDGHAVRERHPDGDVVRVRQVHVRTG